VRNDIILTYECFSATPCISKSKYTILIFLQNIGATCNGVSDPKAIQGYIATPKINVMAICLPEEACDPSHRSTSYDLLNAMNAKQEQDISITTKIANPFCQDGYVGATCNYCSEGYYRYICTNLYVFMHYFNVSRHWEAVLQVSCTIYTLLSPIHNSILHHQASAQM
jgi:hypothetical protein